MKRKGTFSSISIFFVVLGTIIASANTSMSPEALSKLRNKGHYYLPDGDDTKDSTDKDTLRYPFDDDQGNPFIEQQQSPLYLNSPANIQSSFEYNEKTGQYEYRQKVGSFYYRKPNALTLGEYTDHTFDQSLQNYWDQRVKNERMERQNADPFSKFLNPQLNVPIVGFDKIFGTSTVDIKPRGAAELNFGIHISKNDDPALPKHLRNHVSFDFDEKIQMGVTGSIGDKMKIGINYNTEAVFDFENETKLGYTGKEDEILQNIEAGNVTLPLTGTLISGSHSLFGLKTELKFGKLYVTSIFSQQKGQSQSFELKQGALAQEFKVYADEYEANRHFFLSHYFRDNYNRWLENLPIIQSGIKIEKLEVYVTNRNWEVENTRDIVAFIDLGESMDNVYAENGVTGSSGNVHPGNETNNLYEQLKNLKEGIRESNQITNTLKSYFPDFESGIHWNKIDNARKLTQGTDYDFNPDLGIISLRMALNTDEVLAVAFEYTLNGERFEVGELSTDLDAPKALILKMIKGTSLTPSLPTWDLMMKNVYDIGAYQVGKENFMLEVMYQDDRSGTDLNYIPEGKNKNKTLLRVLGLDNLNEQNDPIPDGFFDFIDRITINTQNGRIFFPVLEPFGADLLATFENKRVGERYIFPELYSKTQTEARQLAEKNKFYLTGEYESSSGSEIMLNAMNIPEGSVKVSASGQQLAEGVDYLVDYTLGRVTILNQALLESGTPIKVDFENNSLFNMQTKTLIGTHLDYRFSENFQLGGTILHLSEKPLTNKVSIGNEPISNTIWGLDGSYSAKVPWLTKMVDKIPLIDTKTMSTITVNAEFAHLIPGHSRVIDKDGVSYIDDFEGSKYTFDLKTPAEWHLASVPQGQPLLFREGDLSDTLLIGYNRAKIAWYNILTDLLREGAPGYISKDDQSNHYVREVYEQDLWPEKESPNAFEQTIPILNVAYYPTEKGPYNYDAKGTGYSKGINEDGTLKDPETRWGGIMRKITQSDFETANIEFIEFWMMDPFVYDENSTGGDLYFNLGNISEDILRDSRQIYENGLPTSEDKQYVDTTLWGKVSLVKPINRSFDNNEESRKFQDVGLDGLSDQEEVDFFNFYLNEIAELYGQSSEAYRSASEDASNDNWLFFKDEYYDDTQASILERYKNYNGVEGNSPVGSNSTTLGQRFADSEDIKEDYTLDEVETYFQYRISLRPHDMQVGQNYITDVIEDTEERKNKQTSTVKWYQFRIPIYNPDSKVGPISDFKSIRFIRMLMKNFDENVVLRFAKLDLVRGEWRKYNFDLADATEGTTYPQQAQADFDITAVNIEENGSRTPINYVLPPGVDRVIDPNNPQLRQLNEQAIVFKVKDLEDGDARAAYKNVYLDVRQYKKLKMYVHAEQIDEEYLANNDLSMFIRLGSDFKENYYEYEIPLTVTPEGNYENESSSDRKIVWPKDNELNLEFQKLIDAKKDRNAKDYNPAVPYIIQDGNNRIRVKGYPNIADLKTIMLGIRNPKQETNPNDDDGYPKTGEIWFNELRLSDFNEEGGWAANARVVAKLADFATVTMSGNTSRPGFGGIEKKVSERQKETINDYSLASNIEFGKFFPQRFGVRIPVFVEYAERFSDPQYNPLDPDVLMKDALNNARDNEEKERLKDNARDYTRRKSINLTNVRIENISGKEGKERKQAKFYSPSNFSFGLSYSENYHENVNIEYDKQTRHSNVISYIYNATPKNVAPFKKVRMLSSPALALIKNLNFYYLPKQISFRWDMNRDYQEMQYRNNSPLDNELVIEPSVQKNFTLNRIYDVKYDLTRNLQIDYSATNTQRLGEKELDGQIDDDDYDLYRENDIMEEIKYAQNSHFDQAINATWNVPINQLPLMDIFNLRARYSGKFIWDRGPKLKNTTGYVLGHNVKNSNTLNLNADMSMQKLYSRVGFLDKIDKEMKQRKAGRNPTQKKVDVEYEKKGVKLRKNKGKTIIHKLATRDVKVVATDKTGKQIKGDVEVLNGNKLKFTPDSDAKDVTLKVTGKKIENENILVTIGKYTVNAMMGLKRISATYVENNSIVLPGYNLETQYFGLTKHNGSYAPGLPFTLGWNDTDIAARAGRNGWYADSLNTISNPFAVTNTKQLSFTAGLEPIPGLRIDLKADWSEQVASNEYWTQTDDNRYEGRNKLTTKQMSMSYNIIKTAFWSIDDNNNSKAYDNFLKFRKEIAMDMAGERDRNHTFVDLNKTYGQLLDSTNQAGAFPYGYSGTSQDVLIKSFLAAYSGAGALDRMEIFPKIPGLNWRVTYDGLTQIPAIGRIFKKIRLNHAYNCSYQVGKYQNNTDYLEGEYGFSYVRDKVESLYFVPKYDIPEVSIREDFAPFLNLDMTWNNSMTTKVEYRRSRDIALTLTNNQIMESRRNEIIVGAGYRFNKFPLIISKKKIESDLNLRADVSVKDNIDIIRKIAEGTDQVRAGTKNVSIAFNADYVLNERFNIGLYYNHNIVNPKTSQATRTVDIKFGFTVRFTLMQ